LDSLQADDTAVLDPAFESARQAASRIPEHWSKRCFDVALSGAGLVFGGVFLAAIWLAVRLTSKGPGVYWSERVGKDGITFWMPKFRSMAADAPTLPREQMSDAGLHITPIGHFLRQSSLDELPQLVSVLQGHMSLIGPRPLLASDPGVRARWDFPAAMAVRPGLTGLAQVRGRNAVTARQKARYDALYARRWTWLMDLTVLLATAKVVITRRGIL
jgi:O-antigen biosynthesis protein WbqP